METQDTTSLSDLDQMSLKSLGIGVAGKHEIRMESDIEVESCDWQLLFHSIQQKIRRKSDLLIALTHFLVTQEYRLRNTTNSTDSGGSTSELLPSNWNRDAHRYTLHYIDQLGSQYVLLAKLSRKDLVISLQNSTSKRMSIACLQPENIVRSTSKSYLEKCIPKTEKIIDRLRCNLVDPVVRGTKRTAEAPFFAQRIHEKKKLLLRNPPPLRVTFNLIESTHASVGSDETT
ncbi:proteasome inhibitor PI31 subunit [Drosophila rhopaloa]|uniref:Proteasome inhibitor PI31 subunit n=1 Tax=Drosophila rhopaloa TaxID=1041015 RepID=A0A6P4F1E4_DRORH|nr:proteasome inhibitor PI31 subunit [Drosophila rhopaloa]